MRSQLSPPSLTHHHLSEIGCGRLRRFVTERLQGRDHMFRAEYDRRDAVRCELPRAGHAQDLQLGERRDTHRANFRRPRKTRKNVSACWVPTACDIRAMSLLAT